MGGGQKRERERKSLDQQSNGLKDWLSINFVHLRAGTRRALYEIRAKEGRNGLTRGNKYSEGPDGRLPCGSVFPPPLFTPFLVILFTRS